MKLKSLAYPGMQPLQLVGKFKYENPAEKI